VKNEPVANLQRAISALLLDAFSARNQGQIPKRIIVYRDGVADNQFESVLEKELVAYKDALMLKGYYGEDEVQIAIVMCQKRHHTRLVYQYDEGNPNRNPDSKEFINPCVGLCVDGRAFLKNKDPDAVEDGDAVGSINSPNTNEFYLNSQCCSSWYFQAMQVRFDL
jgi:hypothetical protein